MARPCLAAVDGECEAPIESDLGNASLPPDWEWPKAQRVGNNDAAFKEHNERRKALEESVAGADELIPFVCECGDAGCYAGVSVTIAQFAQAHAMPRRYAVKPDTSCLTTSEWFSKAIRTGSWRSTPPGGARRERSHGQFRRGFAVAARSAPIAGGRMTPHAASAPAAARCAILSERTNSPLPSPARSRHCALVWRANLCAARRPPERSSAGCNGSGGGG